MDEHGFTCRNYVDAGWVAQVHGRALAVPGPNWKADQWGSLHTYLDVVSQKPMVNLCRGLPAGPTVARGDNPWRDVTGYSIYDYVNLGWHLVPPRRWDTAKWGKITDDALQLRGLDIS